MINHQENIKLYLSQSLIDMNLSNRIWLSKGTNQVDLEKVEKQSYNNDAIIPKFPWRILTESEPSLYLTQSPPIEFSGDWISLIKIPDDVLEPFIVFRYASHLSRNSQDIRILRERDDIKLAIQTLAEFISQIRVSKSDTLDGIGIAVNNPNLITTTYDYQNKCFIGLHLDSWYGAHLKDRLVSPNRICINLGNQDRFLLYINLPVKTIFNLLEENFPDDNRRYSLGRSLGVAFMEHWPDYPVTRLRIAPYEAYIAPTENMIHDGSTEGTTAYDVNLTIRSRFISNF